MIIECSVARISLDIGNGNKLILFKGDKIRISPSRTETGRRLGQYRVLDSSSIIIGHIGRRSIRRITGKSIEALKEENNALVTTG